MRDDGDGGERVRESTEDVLSGTAAIIRFNNSHWLCMWIGCVLKALQKPSMTVQAKG